MRQNKMTIIGITFVVFVLMVVLVLSGRRLSAKLQAGQRQISELEEETERENRRTQEISELQEYMKSDEYIEQAAKEKLGLVKDGEIIFREK